MTYGLDGAEVMCFSDVEEIELPEGVGLVMPRQTHTVNVGMVASEDDRFPETDALVTQLRGVAVGVRTADCVPVMLYAPDVKAVAAVHAGWKGTVGGIVANTIRGLAALGADPALMKAVFGPSICGECYETGPDLADKFVAAGLGEAVIRGGGVDPLGEKVFDSLTVRIDLQKANTIIMEKCGVAASNIVRSCECTRHSLHRWPSWRRESGTQRRLASIIRLT